MFVTGLKWNPLVVVKTIKQIKGEYISYGISFLKSQIYSQYLFLRMSIIAQRSIYHINTFTDESNTTIDSMKSIDLKDRNTDNVEIGKYCMKGNIYH
jgi:hypothetical protein